MSGNEGLFGHEAEELMLLRAAGAVEFGSTSGITNALLGQQLRDAAAVAHARDKRLRSGRMVDGRRKIMVVDGLLPEDIAMVQALYARSPKSAEEHIEKVHRTGHGKFMSSYYVGYNHKSIGDCGTTTMFIEKVSLLVAKAVQNWSLYSGQETSTRAIDMSNMSFVDPLGSPTAHDIQQRMLDFYMEIQNDVMDHIRKTHPRREGEDEAKYEAAVKSRAFDVTRGFLCAGTETQLSWHSNLRQAADHLPDLINHPLSEVREVGEMLRDLLHNMYPDSGFGGAHVGLSGIGARSEGAEARAAWEREIASSYAYDDGLEQDVRQYLYESADDVLFTIDDTIPRDVNRYRKIFETRPRGCVLPHFLSELGTITSEYLLDFGSFRDIQRHRNGVVRMPMLTMEFGFEQWYLKNLPEDVRVRALKLLGESRRALQQAGHATPPELLQYYIPIGYRVPVKTTFSIPAHVYVLEIRSGKTVHPTLRKKMLQLAADFRRSFPTIKLHADEDEDDWTLRRGTQTITEREARP